MNQQPVFDVFDAFLFLVLDNAHTGEIQDEEKRRVEELQEQLQNQELQYIEQRKQLIQLSQLVDEQKKKLVEQNTLLKKQSNTLASQADGLREVRFEDKKSVKSSAVTRVSTP